MDLEARFAIIVSLSKEPNVNCRIISTRSSIVRSRARLRWEVFIVFLQELKEEFSVGPNVGPSKCCRLWSYRGENGPKKVRLTLVNIPEAEELFQLLLVFS